MKRWTKTILQSPLVQKILVSLCYYYIRFVYLTCQKQIIGIDNLNNPIKAQEPIIIAFWHGRMALLPPAWQWPKNPFSMLLSAHRDGKLIGALLHKFKLKTIEGSSTRGGTEAAIEIFHSLKKGSIIGVTPDGPRGPKQEVSKGILRLAHQSGAKIIPVSYGVSSGKQLRSWDRFLIPHPFSKAYILVGEALHVEDEDWPTQAQKLKTALDTLTQKADAMANTLNRE